MNGIERAQWMRAAEGLCCREHLSRNLDERPEWAIGRKAFQDRRNSALVERPFCHSPSQRAADFDRSERAACL